MLVFTHRRQHSIFDFTELYYGALWRSLGDVISDWSRSPIEYCTVVRTPWLSHGGPLSGLKGPRGPSFQAN